MLQGNVPIFPLIIFLFLILLITSFDIVFLNSLKYRFYIWGNCEELKRDCHALRQLFTFEEYRELTGRTVTIMFLTDNFKNKTNCGKLIGGGAGETRETSSPELVRSLFSPPRRPLRAVEYLRNELEKKRTLPESEMKERVARGATFHERWRERDRSL